MSKHTPGKLLVETALGDSYYPDLGQSVNAERMIEVINSDPLIAAAPDLLEVLKDLIHSHKGAIIAGTNQAISRQWDAALNAIAKAEGK